MSFFTILHFFDVKKCHLPGDFGGPQTTLWPKVFNVHPNRPIHLRSSALISVENRQIEILFTEMNGLRTLDALMSKIDKQIEN